ncbi:MAG: hypothetical protein Q605_AUC01123G0005, partial [Actinomyces urogenitalis DORA_12]
MKRLEQFRETPFVVGAPDRIRTCDLLLRRQTLYPLSYRGPLADCTSAAARSENEEAEPKACLSPGRSASA